MTRTRSRGSKDLQGCPETESRTVDRFPSWAVVRFPSREGARPYHFPSFSWPQRPRAHPPARELFGRGRRDPPALGCQSCWRPHFERNGNILRRARLTPEFDGPRIAHGQVEVVCPDAVLFSVPCSRASCFPQVVTGQRFHFRPQPRFRRLLTRTEWSP